MEKRDEYCRWGWQPPTIREVIFFWWARFVLFARRVTRVDRLLTVEEQLVRVNAKKYSPMTYEEHRRLSELSLLGID